MKESSRIEYQLSTWESFGCTNAPWSERRLYLVGPDRAMVRAADLLATQEFSFWRHVVQSCNILYGTTKKIRH